MAISGVQREVFGDKQLFTSSLLDAEEGETASLFVKNKKKQHFFLTEDTSVLGGVALTGHRLPSGAPLSALVLWRRWQRLGMNGSHAG